MTRLSRAFGYRTVAAAAAMIMAAGSAVADDVRILAPDAGALKGYGPGTVIVVPAGAPHFSACKDGVAVVQESGVGPTGITMTGK